MARLGNWRACLAAGNILLPALTAGTASAAATIDLPAQGGVSFCSDTDVDSTCVLPFGPAIAARSVITKVDLGPIAPRALQLARPDGAGGLVTRPIAATSSRWKPVASHMSTLVHTALAVEPGEQLVVIDPVVSAGGPTVDFEPTGETSLAIGEPVALTPVGTVTYEHDADGDGYGDETQDLCPGMAGGICAPGSVAVAVSVPEYVPARERVVANWTVTNTAPTTQRFVINIQAPPNTQRTYPDGSVCGPGVAVNPTHLWSPTSRRSPLVATPPSGVIETNAMTVHGWANTGKTPWEHCTLPPLAPGASAGGQVTGSWRQDHRVYSGINILALPPFASAGAEASARAAAQVRHGYFDRAKTTKLGTFTGRGSLKAVVACPAPKTGTVPPCTVRGRLRDAPGDRVLGVSRSVTIAPGKSGVVTIKLKASGKRWLAKRPARRLQLAITATRPGEPSVTSMRRFSAKYTKSTRTYLRKLRARR